MHLLDNIQRIALFAGTSEGRIIASALAKRGEIELKVFTATEYGERILQDIEGIYLEPGRKDQAAIEAAILTYELVIDATHPFATEVSKNIKAAAQHAGIPYVRISRKASESKNARYFHDFESAATYLSQVEGRILLTTGSKNIAAFSSLRDRLFARVLPDSASIQALKDVGVAASHIIAMQGPFSADLNAALLRELGISCLVTKDSGSAGGFSEKLEAASRESVEVLVIGRPEEDHDSIVFEDFLALIDHDSEARTQDTRLSESYAPFFFNLKDRKCLVVGGGTIGLRRARLLYSFGAQVEVIDPQELKLDLESDKGIIHTQRNWQPSDISGQFMLVAATDDSKDNAELARFAHEQSILVNVVDDPESCDFFFPALIEGRHFRAGIISKELDHTSVKKAAHKLREAITDIEDIHD